MQFAIFIRFYWYSRQEPHICYIHIVSSFECYLIVIQSVITVHFDDVVDTVRYTLPDQQTILTFGMNSQVSDSDLHRHSKIFNFLGLNIYKNILYMLYFKNSKYFSTSWISLLTLVIKYHQIPADYLTFS